MRGLFLTCPAVIAGGLGHVMAIGAMHPPAGFLAGQHWPARQSPATP